MSFKGTAAKLSCFMTLLLGIHSSESYATMGLTVSGTIVELRTQSSWALESAFFLSGVTSLGVCPTAPTDTGAALVMFRMKADAQGRAQQRTALAAQLIGKTVTVVVDDNMLDSGGNCYIRSIHTTG